MDVKYINDIGCFELETFLENTQGISFLFTVFCKILLSKTGHEEVVGDIRRGSVDWTLRLLPSAQPELMSLFVTCFIY